MGLTIVWIVLATLAFVTNLLWHCFVILWVVESSILNSQRYGELSKQRLDRAILTFFQHFRKSYVGDQAMHSSKVIFCLLSEIIFSRVFFLSLCRQRFLGLFFLLQQLYARLSELLGLHDHLLMLNVIVGKIATNLKCYTEVISWLVHMCHNVVLLRHVVKYFCTFLISEWGGHWSHFEFVLGAGFWVSFVTQKVFWMSALEPVFIY